ncbi:hypothetical protein WS70_10350 [Burkholderia mayonis]|uniref:Uncharacterized protein n=1 Tax=Burkholderia mayonis TaxID=1385591 RepID=A0A1B4FEW4_9BURK|nr:hypothetical protein WS70_10350 [Burkholderia mayonis]KVE34363.1 hypothetical protein WS69_17450 [Burkholderia sp. BDU5]KVE44124.1 hypothetical protein WS70_08200 [Burkholderia mayonis]
MRTKRAKRRVLDGLGYEIRFSVGRADFDPNRHPTIGSPLAAANRQTYADKHRARATCKPHNRTGCVRWRRVARCSRSTPPARCAAQRLPPAGFACAS